MNYNFIKKRFIVNSYVDNSSNDLFNILIDMLTIRFYYEYVGIVIVFL